MVAKDADRQRLDTVRYVETPENVEVTLAVAGVPARAAAYLVDLLIRVVLFVAAATVVSQFGKVGEGLLLLLFFGLEWLYPVLFEVLGGGATPGKRALGLAVLHQDGTPVGWASSVVRNLLRAADFLPVFYGAGLVSMLVDRDFRRLGDLAAGTRVVYRERLASPVQLGGTTPLPPPVPIGREEQRAILGFAERLPTWSPERAQELADLAAPLTDARGPAGLERLLAHALWLVGKR